MLLNESTNTIATASQAGYRCFTTNPQFQRYVQLEILVQEPVIMSDIGKSERETQNRIVELFRDELGYEYLGDWTDREGNSNIEEGLLTDYLTRNGYTPAQIRRPSISCGRRPTTKPQPLREQQAVYNLLRYGVPVKTEASKVTETVHLINWKQPEKNDFAIAEEVTLQGNHDRRPDIVLYVNGIAIGVIEFKNSRDIIGDGIRQNLSNQRPEFMRGSSARFSLFSPAMTPKDCDMGPSGRRKSISSSGRKTSKTTVASSWTSICSRCAKSG